MLSQQSKFKSNPYNPNNILISSTDMSFQNPTWNSHQQAKQRFDSTVQDFDSWTRLPPNVAKYRAILEDCEKICE